MLEHAQTEWKTEQWAFMREVTKNAPTAMQIKTCHKKFKEENCVRQKDLDVY